jgi:hypothetical protein
MQLDERVLTHLVSERQSATFTTFTTAAWVTVTVPHPERTNANGIAVAKRDEAAATTIDTGIRREHAGGIIIGVSIGGLILLVFLAWCCTSGRRRSRSSDTSCSSRSTSRPSHSPPPKPEHVSTFTTVPPPPSSGYFSRSTYIPPFPHLPFGSGPGSFPPPSRPPFPTGQPPSKSGNASISKPVPPPSEKHADVPPLTPPKVEKPTQAHKKPARPETRPAVKSGLADEAYEERSRKTTRKKDGKEFVVEEKNPKKAYGWVRENLNRIPDPEINTFPEE